MDINQKLQNIFKTQLRENYSRRIVFWKDPEREFENQLDELSLGEVQIIKLTGKNNFAVKQLLSEDDLVNDYLVYDPISYNDIREDWLLDIELYSEIFRADLVSLRMQDLNIPDQPALRQVVKGYSKFFGSKERMAKLAAYHSDYQASPAQLHLDILAVLSGAENNTSQAILRTILSDDPDIDENESIRNIRKFGSEAVLWEMVQKLTGYEYRDDNSLLPLASHILMSALSMTVPTTDLKGLEQYVSRHHQEICYAFVNEWLHTGKQEERQEQYYKLARRVEDFLGLSERFIKLDISSLWDSEVFPCIDEAILRKFMTEISENQVQTEEILGTIEKRRTHIWYDRFASFYEGLRQTAQMQRFTQQNAIPFGDTYRFLEAVL